VTIPNSLRVEGKRLIGRAAGSVLHEAGPALCNGSTPVAPESDEVTRIEQTIDDHRPPAAARPPAPSDARHWVTALAPYREPSLARSLTELVVTLVPFVALWLLMLASLRYS
jgi:hypothetical protein